MAKIQYRRINTVLIYGSGSWGSALAFVLSKKFEYIILYSRNQNIVHDINHNKKNTKYLGDIIFPQNVVCVNSLNQDFVIDLLVMAVPSYSFSEALDHIKSIISTNVNFLIATKGLTSNPTELLSDRFKKYFSNEFAFIAGPNLAKEIACGLSFYATIASENIFFANFLKEQISSDTSHVESSQDIITMQVASIIKNIISIKSGILYAQKLGENAQAALITEGLKEIKCVSCYLGSNNNKVELISYGILGDLIATAHSMNSRNKKFGYEIYRHNFDKEFIKNYPYLVEGLGAVKLLREIVPNDISLPNVDFVFKLLF